MGTTPVPKGVAMKVLSSASNFSDDRPTLWVWTDQEMIAGSHMVPLRGIAEDQLVQSLPAGISELFIDLVSRNLVAELEISEPSVPTTARNQIRLRAVGSAVSGHTRLHELVVTAERMTGHLRPTDEELLEVAATEGRTEGSKPPEVAGGDNLRLRWLLALRRLAERS